MSTALLDAPALSAKNEGTEDTKGNKGGKGNPSANVARVEIQPPSREPVSLGSIPQRHPVPIDDHSHGQKHPQDEGQGQRRWQEIPFKHEGMVVA